MVTEMDCSQEKESEKDMGLVVLIKWVVVEVVYGESAEKQWVWWYDCSD